jgi:MoaA/NifB/PqqE/SkfB family radical SAM enzyme
MKAEVLAGIRAGRPQVGPSTVHVDITNTCNAACVTCWDHSPLLREPRSASWKRQRLPLARFMALLEDLDAFGSLRSLILSGMGEPLMHPEVHAMIEAVTSRGWALTLITNLVAPAAEALARGPAIANVLVGVHGVTPDTYAAAHPGWDEAHFFRLCRNLRALGRSPSTTRHVHVITTLNAHELPDMVRFGARFGAQRVNFKLASLGGGTESLEIRPEQRRWLLEEGVPAAQREARRLGQATTLELFARQLRAGPGATTDMRRVGCFMGYVYARVTVSGELWFCCSPDSAVGHLDAGPLRHQWEGPAWQAMRERLARGELLPGCARCGKVEQNLKIARALGRVP